MSANSLSCPDTLAYSPLLRMKFPAEATGIAQRMLLKFNDLKRRDVNWYAYTLCHGGLTHICNF